MEHRKIRRPAFFHAVLRAESGDYTVKIRNATLEGENAAGLGGIVLPNTQVSLFVRNKK